MDLAVCADKIMKYFNDVKDISTVYLFGSFVKDRARKGSDVDIAVLFTKNLPLIYRFERKLEITNDMEDKLQKSVDIVDLENADLFFIHQVMLNKKLIIDKDINRRVEFEIEKRRAYFDRKDFYNLYHSQNIKRLEERRRKYQNG